MRRHGMCFIAWSAQRFVGTNSTKKKTTFFTELLEKVIAVLAYMHSDVPSAMVFDVCPIGCPHECTQTVRKCQRRPNRSNFYLFDASKVTHAPCPCMHQHYNNHTFA